MPAQDTAAKEWVALLCKRMKTYGLDAYIGKTINGIEITDSGIIAGAHLKGFGNDKNPGVKHFLKSDGKTDPTDGLGTPVSEYVEKFGGYDVGCCKQVSLGFSEKQTGEPICGLKVQVKKNGKPHKTTQTDENGLIKAISGFRPGDTVEILVEKLAGGFKSLKTSVVHDMNLMLSFASPKVKVVAKTELHEGTPESRKTKSVAKIASAEKSDEAFDTMDVLEKIWARMSAHLTPDIKPKETKKGSNGSASKSKSELNNKKLRNKATATPVNKARNTKGHPVAAVEKPKQPPEEKTVSPMQKTIAGLLFPLEDKPTESYKTGARRFGSNRSQGKRKHAGIDLYAPVGTPVRAMADGVVIQTYLFYGSTHVIEVDHATFIARYGEVAEESISVKANERISRGQIIGKVGQLTGLSMSMLHLEMYGTTENPNSSGNGLTQKGEAPFERRSDLIDPTDSIDKATPQ